MIVVDTSAVIAVLLDEPDGRRYLQSIAEAAACRMSIGNALELSIVVLRRSGDSGLSTLDAFIHAQGISLAPVDEDQYAAARNAYERYGKGRHPAGLNFGDCFAYALAKALDAPLLFKGTDFGRTDVQAVDIGAA